MARASTDNLHTRLVNVLKLVLPLLALVLLSTLFLFSKKINPEDAIPYASVDVEDRMRDPKMTEAGFAGVTDDGASIAITAAEATPASDGGTMQQVVGSLTTLAGARTEFSALTVRLDSAADLLQLGGGTTLKSSGGYDIATEGLQIATKQTHIESTGPIRAVGPIGDLSADKLVLSQPQADGPYLLVFKGAVRLIYTPEQRQDK